MSSRGPRQDIPRKPWELCLLDTLAKRGSGHTPDKKHPEYWGGGIKWVSLKDSDRLDRVYISETVETISRAGINNSSAVEHPPGTVVLSRDAGVGKSAVTTDTMAVSQHFIAWQCGPRLDNLFLYYWLQYRKTEFERVAIGNTIKTIGLPYFRQLCLPVPPIYEQRAIAVALSDVDALIAALDQLIAKKRDLRTATIQQLITGQRRLPGFTDTWQTKRLGSLGAVYGGLAGKTKENFGRGSARYVTFLNVMNNVVLDLGSFERVEVADSETQTRVVKGDLFFNGSSETANELGMCAMLAESVDEVYLNSFCFGFRMAPVAAADPLFLAYLFRSPVGRQLIYTLAQGAIRYNLPKAAFLRLNLRLPSNGEQVAIAAVLQDCDAELKALEARLEKTKLIKEGMMQELLTGRTRLVEVAP